MVANISYTIECDLDRTGDYSSPIADLTRFVKGTIQFNYGIQQTYEGVAAPARMTFTVTNVGSEFDRDRLGSELIANGGFDNWTADIPDQWSVSDISAAIANISQCGADETISPFGSHSGSGACGFYSISTNGSVPSLTQTGLFIPGKTYRISIPVTARKQSTPLLDSTVWLRALTN